MSAQRPLDSPAAAFEREYNSRHSGERGDQHSKAAACTRTEGEVGAGEAVQVELVPQRGHSRRAQLK
jgi:hypothetical protein